MPEIKYKIDDYSIEIYACDRKGRRTRWGDRILRLYSEDKEVGQAVFTCEGAKIPEPYLSEGKIYYFASWRQYPDVIELLRNSKPVFLAWKPVHDPKESQDGDAYFYSSNLNNS